MLIIAYLPGKGKSEEKVPGNWSALFQVISEGFFIDERPTTGKGQTLKWSWIIWVTAFWVIVSVDKQSVLYYANGTDREVYKESSLGI